MTDAWTAIQRLIGEALIFITNDELESRFDLASGANFTSYTFEHLRRVAAEQPRLHARPQG